MAKRHQLDIILQLRDKASSGFKAAGNAARRLGQAIGDGVKQGRDFLRQLTQDIFFVGNAFSMLKNAAQSVFDTFIKGAGDAAKLEARMKVLTGSSQSAAQVMDYLRSTAQRTGADFEELSHGANLLVVAAKDASGAFDFAKFTQMSDILQRMAAFRPDVPLDRLARGISIAVKSGDWHSLEMFLDIPLRQLMGISDAAEDVAKAPGEIGRGVTYVETGVKEAGTAALASVEKLDEALKKAGITADLVSEQVELSGLERMNETIKDIFRTIGEPLFEALNDELGKFADWLQENPELVEELASALGRLGATGIRELFEALTKLLASIDWDALVDKAVAFMDALSEGDTGAMGDILDTIGQIGDALQGIADFFGKIQGIGEKLGVFPGSQGPGEGERGIGKDIGGGPMFTVKEGGLADKLIEGAQAWKDTIEGLKGLLEKDPEPVKVEVDLKSDMLDARIHSGADERVAHGINRLGEAMEE